MPICYLWIYDVSVRMLWSRMSHQLLALKEFPQVPDLPDARNDAHDQRVHAVPRHASVGDLCGHAQARSTGARLVGRRQLLHAARHVVSHSAIGLFEQQATAKYQQFPHCARTYGSVSSLNHTITALNPGHGMTAACSCGPPATTTAHRLFSRGAFSLPPGLLGPLFSAPDTSDMCPQKYAYRLRHSSTSTLSTC
eukprot:364570-Chlamydomonas_euryale.AAC.19